MAIWHVDLASIHSKNRYLVSLLHYSPQLQHVRHQSDSSSNRRKLTG